MASPRFSSDLWQCLHSFGWKVKRSCGYTVLPCSTINLSNASFMLITMFMRSIDYSNHQDIFHIIFDEASRNIPKQFTITIVIVFLYISLEAFIVCLSILQFILVFNFPFPISLSCSFFEKSETFRILVIAALVATGGNKCV